MEQRDQHYRQPGLTDAEKADAVNVEQLKRLKQIVKVSGWPTKSMVDEDGAYAAWLITQHADQDRAFQTQVLAMIEPLRANGEVSAETYAYLYDRIHTPQRYGTQGECQSVGRWVPRVIENPELVDHRRQQVGMMMLATYIELVSSYLCVATQ